MSDDAQRGQLSEFIEIVFGFFAQKVPMLRTAGPIEEVTGWEYPTRNEAQARCGDNGGPLVQDHTRTKCDVSVKP